MAIGVLVMTAVAPLVADDDDPFGGVVADDGYQAVTLSDGRTYFGRLLPLNDSFFRLDDAYVLRGDDEQTGDEDPGALRTLVPIGREPHTPENRLLIARDEVVTVANLDESSAVREEIERNAADSP